MKYNNETNMTPHEFDIMEKEIEFEREKEMPKSTSFLALPLNFYVAQMDLAMTSGNNELIWHIFQKKRNLLELGDEIGRTYLFRSVYGNNLKCVKTLLKLGANPNVSTLEKSDSCHDLAGSTSLWRSIKSYRYFIDLGNEHPTFDFSSIYATCKAIIKCLLVYGAVAAPKLDQKDQLLLDEVGVVLDKEKEQLRSALNFVVLPQDISSKIVEYLKG